MRDTTTAWFVIPCGAAKTSHPAPARHLYTGAHFRNTLRRVQAEADATPGARVLILSARYGLVTPDTVLPPYDLKMGQPGAANALTVATTAHAYGVTPGDGVYGFLPAAYQRVLSDGLHLLGVYPLDGYEAAPGIGYQRGTLAHLGT